jgi:hypothetical protein
MPGLEVFDLSPVYVPGELLLDSLLFLAAKGRSLS